MSEVLTIQNLKDKLARTSKTKAILSERSKQLQQQVDDFRKREEVMGHMAYELLERQRELNFMLHRASSVLHQVQDTNRALSAEFTHIVKELPSATGDPESDWDDTLAKVNSLFEKTHELASEMQEEIFKTSAEPDKNNSWAEIFSEPRKESKTSDKTDSEDAPAQSTKPEAVVEPEIAVTSEIVEAELAESEESPVAAEIEASLVEETIDGAWTAVEPEEPLEDVWASKQSEASSTEPIAKPRYDVFSIQYAQDEDSQVDSEDPNLIKAGGGKDGFLSRLFKRG